MSDSHKAALAEGRAQGRAVRTYLEAIEAHKPKRGRKRTQESMTKRLAKIDAEYAEGDQLKKLQLAQERLDLQRELSSARDRGRPERPRERLRVGRWPLWRAQGHHLCGVARGGRARLGAAGRRHLAQLAITRPAAAHGLAVRSSVGPTGPQLRRRPPAGTAAAGSRRSCPAARLEARSGWGMSPTTLPTGGAHPGDVVHRPIGVVDVTQHDPVLVSQLGQVSRPSTCSCPRSG